MKSITKYSLVGVTTVLLAACGSSDSTKSSATTPKATVVPTATTKPATTPTTSAITPTTKPAVTTTAPASASTAAAAEVKLATTSLGMVLVDADGRTLYLDSNDTQNKPSTCEQTCATTWPPLVAAKLPTAGTDLTAGKLTLMARPDGTEQVAYNGWPLYLYSKDIKAGDVTGEKIGGFFAVDAAGAAVGK